jgi:hypothetical protein
MALFAARLRPQNFQNTRNISAMKIAPPTPHTTPITVFRVCILMPSLVLALLSTGEAVVVGMEDDTEEMVCTEPSEDVWVMTTVVASGVKVLVSSGISASVVC